MASASATDGAKSGTVSLPVDVSPGDLRGQRVILGMSAFSGQSSRNQYRPVEKDHTRFSVAALAGSRRLLDEYRGGLLGLVHGDRCLLESFTQCDAIVAPDSVTSSGLCYRGLNKFPDLVGVHLRHPVALVVPLP